MKNNKFNELMKNFNPLVKGMPTEEDCKRMKAQEAYYRPRFFKILGEEMLKLFKIVCGGVNG